MIVYVIQELVVLPNGDNDHFDTMGLIGFLSEHDKQIIDQSNWKFPGETVMIVSGHDHRAVVNIGENMAGDMHSMARMTKLLHETRDAGHPSFLYELIRGGTTWSVTKESICDYTDPTFATPIIRRERDAKWHLIFTDDDFAFRMMLMMPSELKCRLIRIQ
jgi:hypothetical protein